MNIKKLNHGMLIILILFAVLSIIIFPGNSLKAAKSGINLWLFTVFPALLPFFIGSELLLQLGFVFTFGKLLEPVMRPIFKVPGSGSFAMAVGYTSGYPIGAQIIARLWEEKMINTIEAERLMTFCNNSGPLFMLGAVAMGMFNSPKVGYILMISNYMGAMTTGLIFRNYKQKVQGKININSVNNFYKKNKQENAKNFGNILGDAVKSSMNTMLLIGGYIIIFSVLIEFLRVYGIISILGKLVSPIFISLGFDKNIISGYISGLMEITIGSKLISQSTAPLYQKVILISSILAWGGFSTHGQVLGVISKAKISYAPYFLSKIIHSILAALYSYFILKFIDIGESSIAPVFYQYNLSYMFNVFQLSSFILIISILIFILISYMFALIHKGT